MKRLLMISGDRSIARGRRGAFFNTLSSLHEHWDQIDIITPGIGVNISQTIFGNVNIHSSPWPLVLQPLFIWKKGAQLYRKQPFDIITVHEYPPFYNGIGAWLLHREIHVPYILEVMHIAGYPRAGTFKERVYRLLIKLFMRFDAASAKAVRVINKKETPEFLASVGVPREKLKYIPAFYIDLEVFKPDENAEKQFDVIFAGRLVSNKGIFLLLEALKDSHFTACIVGDGPEREKIKSYLRKHNMDSRVKLHGWAIDAEEVARLMNASRICVMSSYNEGGPRVVLEAMACGVPVIATPVGIVHDIIRNNESGRVVSWNADAIASALKDILNSPETHTRLKEAGLEITKQFEREAAIRTLADTMKSIA